MTEDLLRAALRDRADQTAYHPTPLSEVAATARGIRRRRRTTGVLVAAAAVVAITVPLAVVASRSNPDSAPVEPGPTETVLTPDATSPRIAYAVDGTIINPDATSFSPPADLGISGFTAYDGGYLVADRRFFEGSVGLTHYDPDGRVLDTWSSTGLAVGRDGTTAWSSFVPPESGLSGPTVIHRDDEAQGVDQIHPSVQGLIGNEVVYDVPIRTGVWITDLVDEPRLIPGLSSAGGVDGDAGLVAGQAMDSTSGIVVDVATGEVLWEAEDTALGQFSPDGRHVLGQIDISHRGGCCTRVILDAATGEVVTRLPQSSNNEFPTLGVVVWEDDTHVLGSRSSNSTQAILRFDLEGRSSLALDWRMLTGQPDVVFAAQP